MIVSAKGKTANPRGGALKKIRDVAEEKAAYDLKKTCQKATPLVVNYLLETIQNPRAGSTARIRAAEILLDRGWGKPIQPAKELCEDETYSDFLKSLQADE